MVKMDDVEIVLDRNDDTARDIMRCLYTLYRSRVGTLALDRDFGIDWSFIDKPIATAKAMIEAELIRKTRKYESRAEVQSVTWTGNASNGLVKPKVVLKIVD